MADDLSQQKPNEDAHEQKRTSSVKGKEMGGKIMGWVLALMVAILALCIGFSFKSLYPISSSSPSPQQKLFKVDELALYNGTDEGLPILLGILGSVFDVTKGKTHYGVGGGYNHFAGRFVISTSLINLLYIFRFVLYCMTMRPNHLVYQ